MKITRLFALTSAVLFFYNHSVQSQSPLAYYTFNADAKDYSGYGNHGFISGGVFPTKDRFGNDCGAMKFNGSDGYITVPHSYTLSRPQKQYSVAVWFNAHDGSEYSDLQWMTICCKSDIPQETENSPQYRLQSTRYTVSMNTDFTEKFDHKIQFNRWYFYVVTYDGDYCRVYLDGKEIFNFEYKTEFKKNSLALEIGRDLPGKVEFFCGAMDELRIYDTALTPYEIKRLYKDESDKDSEKPCGTDNQKPKKTIPKPPAPKKGELPTTLAPKEYHPTLADGDSIEYQQVITVNSREVQLLFYDGEREDGDIISVNFNGAWIVEKYKLRKKTTATPKTVKLSLIPNFENYLYTKAWNLGSTPPNTLTLEIVDLKNRNTPSQIVNINSRIGKSGAIKLIYKE